VQALAIGDCAFSVQYHVELTPTTVTEWGAIPEYKAALESSLGDGALDRLVAETDAHMAAFNRDARQLYDNFMKTLA
jgi:GMP synthase-like glutamine amidotransferase